MAKNNLPKRLFKNKDVVHTYQHEREIKAGMKQMVREHMDVLQNIEFALIACSQKDPRIDDWMIDSALEHILQRIEMGKGTKPQVWMMCQILEQMRETRADVTDDIWHGGLRTVRESVRRHSNLQPGEKTYIQFVSQYLV